MSQLAEGEMQARIAVPATLLKYPQLATRYTTALQNVHEWKVVRERDAQQLPEWLLSGAGRVLAAYWFVLPERGLLEKLEQLRALRAKLHAISEKLLRAISSLDDLDVANGSVLIEPTTVKSCLKLFDELVMKSDNPGISDALGEDGQAELIGCLQPLATMFARETLKTDLKGRVIVRSHNFKQAVAQLMGQVEMLNRVIKHLDPSDKPYTCGAHSK